MQTYRISVIFCPSTRESASSLNRITRRGRPIQLKASTSMSCIQRVDYQSASQSGCLLDKSSHLTKIQSTGRTTGVSVGVAVACQGSCGRGCSHQRDLRDDCHSNSGCSVFLLCLSRETDPVQGKGSIIKSAQATYSTGRSPTWLHRPLLKPPVLRLAVL